MANTILEKIREALLAAGVEFREIHHEPTYTSEDSARARGEDLRIGGKALLIHTGEGFKLFVLSGARKLDNAALRRSLGLRKTRFATPDELMELSGLVPGSVPPFGPPILPFELYVDESILANEKIAFNAGSLTDSIVMKVEDFIHISQPIIFSFSY